MAKKFIITIEKEENNEFKGKIKSIEKNEAFDYSGLLEMIQIIDESFKNDKGEEGWY